MSATSNISIANARIGFRNFSGKEGKFNTAGDRNFCVFLDDRKLVEVLIEDGWNIRWLEPRDEGADRQPYLPVKVSFKNYPPKIMVITSHGKNLLTEDTVEILDWAEIEKVDLIVRPYNYDVNGKKGVKAYVKSMYVTVVEDEFESQYIDAPDSAISTAGGCGNCEACDGTCQHD